MTDTRVPEAETLPSNTRRAVTLMVFQIVVMVISLATGVITARLLGPHDRGVYAIAFLPGQLLSALFGGGIAEATIYMISGNHASHARVLRGLVGLCVGASLLVLGLLAALWVPLAGNVLQGVDLQIFLIANIATPLYLVALLGQAYLFATGRTALSQGPVVCERIVTLLGLAAAAAVGTGLRGVVAVSSAGVACSAALVLALIGPRELAAALRASGSRAATKRMLSYGSTLIVGQLAQRLTYRLDQLIINVLVGPTTVGYYAVAARIAEFPLLLPRALRMSWSAARARAQNIDEATEATLRGNRKLVALMAITLPVYGAIIVPLVPLIYGRSFAGSQAPLAVLLLATFSLSLSFAFVSGLIGGGKPRQVATAMWIGLASTVALDLALVPPFGAIGAAFASFGAYFAFSMAIFLLWRSQAKRVHVGLSALVPRPRDAREAIAPLVRLLRTHVLRPTAADR